MQPAGLGPQPEVAERAAGIGAADPSNLLGTAQPEKADVELALPAPAEEPSDQGPLPLSGPPIEQLKSAEAVGPAEEMPAAHDDTKEAFAQRVPIDLATALALAAGRNPRVQYAAERMQEAMARLDGAEILWLPSIHGGASYNKHEGPLQETGGAVLDVSRGAAFSGLGARAAGAASPAVPGVSATFHLTDAIFQPRVAGRLTAASQYAASAATNDTLLDVALSHLDLLGALEQSAIAQETLKNTRELTDLTESFAKAGQGLQADADRAQAELAVRKNNLARAAEQVRVSQVRLAQHLSVDPTLPLVPAEPTAAPMELVPLEMPLGELVATGLSNRPELAESKSLVAAAVEQFRRERYAPLIPSVALGVSYGGFGGGSGGDIDNYRDRLDVDVAAFWELRNLGFGERPAREGARSRIRQAQWQEVLVMDRVAAEVAAAHSQVVARRPQIDTAKVGIQKAVDSYRRNLDRIRQAEGLPIEALQSIQALDQARREYLRTVIDYNEAQFRLHRALGWPVDLATP
ncbi:MAG: TolC family protein [Planctomycetia bacterium]|nr:TolC family protein [Planctomycetia bacterium]